MTDREITVGDKVHRARRHEGYKKQPNGVVTEVFYDEGEIVGAQVMYHSEPPDYELLDADTFYGCWDSRAFGGIWMLDT